MTLCLDRQQRPPCCYAVTDLVSERVTPAYLSDVSETVVKVHLKTPFLKMAVFKNRVHRVSN